ncbi:MAG: putative O-glycosylation ligase, exosortase A system-associated [Gammaproteobacteria bacterium]
MRDYALLTLIAGLLPFCLFRPWIGALVWCWVGVMAPHRLSWDLRDLPISMMVGALLLVGWLFARDRRSVPWNGALAVLVLFFLYGTTTNLWAWAPDAAWDYWDKVWKMLLMLLVTTTLVYGRDRIRPLLFVAVFSVALFGVKGGIFSILTGGQHKVWVDGGSTIAGNNFLGLAFVMILPLLFAMAREEPKPWVRWALYASFWLTVLATIFTYSRGALLGLLVVLMLTLVKSKKLMLLLILCLPFAYPAKELLPGKWMERQETIVDYQEDTSAMQRIRAWTVAFKIAVDSPLTGAGANFEEGVTRTRWFGFVDQDLMGLGDLVHVAHSSYFQVLGWHGFPALALFLLMLMLAWTELQRLKRDSARYPPLRWIETYAWGIQIGLFGYAVSGAFLNAAYFDLLFLFVALSAMLRREVKQYLATEDAKTGNGRGKTSSQLPRRSIRRIRAAHFRTRVRN